MLRLTTLKISLFSALATLTLLIAMLASTGTATAHAMSSQATAFHHPHIEAYDVMSIGGGCEETQLFGRGFPQGPIQLFASQHGHTLSVKPWHLFANGNGHFSADVIVCGDLFWGHGYSLGHGYGLGYGYGWGYAPMVLVAIDPYGVHSNQVILQ